MKTQLFTNTPENIIKTAEILKSGGLAAIPTETVYGLAADALHGEAGAPLSQISLRQRADRWIIR